MIFSTLLCVLSIVFSAVAIGLIYNNVSVNDNVFNESVTCPPNLPNTLNEFFQITYTTPLTVSIYGIYCVLASAVLYFIVSVLFINRSSRIVGGIQFIKYLAYAFMFAASVTCSVGSIIFMKSTPPSAGYVCTELNGRRINGTSTLNSMATQTIPVMMIVACVLNLSALFVSAALHK